MTFRLEKVGYLVVQFSLCYTMNSGGLNTVRSGIRGCGREIERTTEARNKLKLAMNLITIP